jgi:hypothetical protein
VSQIKIDPGDVSLPEPSIHGGRKVMKKTIYLMLLMTCFLFAACKPQSAKTATKEKPVAEKSAAEAPAATSSPAQPSVAMNKTGKVVETMNAGGYTYVQVDTGTEKFWAAAPEFEVNKGETVTVPPGAPMTNYHSKTLDRDFDLVYFVPSVVVGDATAALSTSHHIPPGHPAINRSDAKAVGIDLTGIKRAEGGKTVGEIFAEKADLAGKEISVRGKVVKYNPQIMGVNWVHIQDGTGEKGTNDLTVTTSDSVKTGDTVLVKGPLTLNKDFGGGYTYDVIIENGKVTVEEPTESAPEEPADGES